MTKRKLERFAENKTFTHFFEPSFHEILKGFKLKGRWNQDFFKSDRPIVLELGCGKGEYTVNLARNYPHKNFIGIDIKGARMWRGGKTSKEEGLPNVAFLRTRIELIEYAFAHQEVSEIWITFPDPQPKKPRKRLTSPQFLERYKKILKEENTIHLKTDNTLLYKYTLDVLKELNITPLVHSSNLYHSGINTDVITIQTYYEALWLAEGKNIKYIRFALPIDETNDH
ncbi:MAG: tRNA (guanosine(46)-N7)-methyltransferase TrmB [Bacteroidales bacterium]|nr:tRNA (guanosine(46)-N7)-methyltransferase TrmB [Bacteroidales bacterium]